MRIGIDLSIVRSGGASLLAQVLELGVDLLWLPSASDALFQDNAGTTAAGTGDPVGLIIDQSGNAINAVTSNDDYRPILNADGSLSFDGIDDRIGATFPDSTLGTDVSVFIGANPGADTQFALASGTDGTATAQYLVRALDGAGGVLVAGVGAATTYVDGALVTTRGEAYAAMTGASTVVEVRNANPSEWTGFFLSGYSTYEYGGKMFPALIIDSAKVNADSRALITAFIEQEMGL